MCASYLTHMEKLRMGIGAIPVCPGIPFNCLVSNLKDLLGFVKELEAQGIKFVSLTDQMDTPSSMRRLVFQIFGALVEYERGLIREPALPGPSCWTVGCPLPISAERWAKVAIPSSVI